MAKKSDDGPLPGYEKLTMADQMRAAALPTAAHTSSTTGAVVNPRREHMKNRIAALADAEVKSATRASLKGSKPPKC